MTCVDLDGDVYELTLQTVQTGAGFDEPASFNVLLFEEGGVLTPTSMFINGQLLFSIADTGRDHRDTTDATCVYSFTTEEGEFNFVVTGLLNIQ